MCRLEPKRVSLIFEAKPNSRFTQLLKFIRKTASKMNAINKNSRETSSSLPQTRAQIRKETKRTGKLDRRQQKIKYRKALNHNRIRYTDHYCGECQHDISGLLDHYCPCSHDDARRMQDHVCACPHQFEAGDDHWCPCPHMLGRGFIDEELLNEIDTKARNRVVEVIFEASIYG